MTDALSSCKNCRRYFEADGCLAIPNSQFLLLLKSFPLHENDSAGLLHPIPPPKWQIYKDWLLLLLSGAVATSTRVTFPSRFVIVRDSRRCTSIKIPVLFEHDRQTKRHISRRQLSRILQLHFQVSLNLRPSLLISNIKIQIHLSLYSCDGFGITYPRNNGRYSTRGISCWITFRNFLTFQIYNRVLNWWKANPGKHRRSRNNKLVLHALNPHS